MDKPAAIAAQLVDIRSVGAHKSIKLTLHVPQEQALLAIEAFGWPTNVAPVPVAIARLTNDAEQAASRDGGADIGLPAPPPALPKPRKPVSPDKRLAQQAGRCCKDPVFLRFLKEVRAINDDGDAPLFVRRFCAVDSRADILPGTEAGEAWDSLYSRFIAWRDHPDIPLADCQGERV